MMYLLLISYFLCSVISLLIWKIGFINCLSSQCNTTTFGFLSRSWLLWGAFFYSLSILLIIFSKKKYSRVLITLGTMFHWSLTIYYFFNENYFCPICISFLLIGTLLNAVYLLKENKIRKSFLLKVFSIVLFVTTLIILVINPIEKNIDDKSELLATEIKRFGPTVEVTNKEGEIEIIDLREKPALLFAEWCSYCSEALKIVANNYKENPPTLLAVLTDESKRKEIEKKLADAGLEGFNYYISTVTPPVKGVPRLVWWEGNHLVELKTESN